jgi:hypothetical protein
MGYYAQFPMPIPHLRVRQDRITHPSATGPCGPVRLACFNHAASVQSEPGSNSSLESFAPRASRPSAASSEKMLSRHRRRLDPTPAGLALAPRRFPGSGLRAVGGFPTVKSPSQNRKGSLSICGHKRCRHNRAVSPGQPLDRSRPPQVRGAAVTRCRDRTLSWTTQLFTFQRFSPPNSIGRIPSATLWPSLRGQDDTHHPQTVKTVRQVFFNPPVSTLFPPFPQIPIYFRTDSGSARSVTPNSPAQIPVQNTHSLPPRRACPLPECVCVRRDSVASPASPPGFGQRTPTSSSPRRSARQVARIVAPVVITSSTTRNSPPSARPLRPAHAPNHGQRAAGDRDGTTEPRAFRSRSDAGTSSCEGR